MPRFAQPVRERRPTNTSAVPQIPIIMPQLGESIAEAAVISFLVKPGDHVQADQDVVEVETNKATMNVTSPCAGRVEKLVVKLNDSYPVGTVLGYVEATVEEIARLGLDEPAPEELSESRRYQNNLNGGRLDWRRR